MMTRTMTNVDWDSKPVINEWPIVYTIYDGKEQINVGLYFKFLDHRTLPYGYSAISYTFYASVYYKGDTDRIEKANWETDLISFDSSEDIVNAATSIKEATKQFYLSGLPDKIDHFYLYGY